MNDLTVVEHKGNVTLYSRSRTFAARSAVLFATVVASAAAVAAPDSLGMDADELKGLILLLIATVGVIGTAYLTVLVSISAFTMIRRVIKG